MKKKLLILVLLVLFIPNIYGITGSGTASSSEKEIIYPVSDPYCEATSGTGFYTLGGVYLRDSTASTTEVTEADYIESTEVYEASNLAKTACDNFSLENKDEGYLCKDTPSRTAYACSGTIVGLSSSQEYLEKYITGGQMFETEDSCLTNCSGTCTLKTGYSYRYAKLVTEENTSGVIEPVGGRMYQTEGGSYAFCIQPAKAFYCPYYYISTKELIPQYCLNTEFDLGTCKNNYSGDYRCGLAYIALKGSGEVREGATSGNTLSEEEYAIIDMAMRMWAINKGHLSGMNSTVFPLKGGKTTTVNFYGITATRVEEDANYLKYGFECTTSSKNHGVVCEYQGYNTYMSALSLYNEALHANELDEAGNKIPKLLTTTLGNSGNTIQMTNPTGETCEIGDANCKVTITLYDSDGNEIPSDSNYCDKNYCYSKYTTESLCKTSSSTVATIEIQIVDFEVSGKVKEYHNCNDPSSKQIMFVIEADGKETTNKDYINQYSAKVACECTDDSGTLKSTTNSGKKCNNYNKMNTASGDYNGVEDGYIKDPSMSTILNSCSGEKYFREKSYETASDTCHIYCRNEIKFYMANKEKVYTGMQFRYELEEKIKNNLGGDEHLTSIVLQQRQCVSEIYYDAWYEKFQYWEGKVAEAWNAWKYWDTLYYEQLNNEVYPQEYAKVEACTANCTGLKQNRTSSFYDTCSAYGSTVWPSEPFTGGGSGYQAYSACENADADREIFNGQNGLCTPACVSIFTWKSRKYNTISYPSGESKPNDTDDIVSGSVANSTLACELYYSVKADAYLYKEKTTTYISDKIVKGDECIKISGTSTYSCKKIETYCDTSKTTSVTKLFGPYKLLITESYQTATSVQTPSSFEIMHDTCIGTYCKLNEDQKSYFKTSPYCGSTSSFFTPVPHDLGSCSAGEKGEIDYVKGKAEDGRKNYNDAQAKVRDLLTDLQACNMYGSKLSGEPDIKYYTLTKSPYTGSGDNSSSSSTQDGGLRESVGGGANGSKAIIIEEDTFSVKNIKADTTEENEKTNFKPTSLESSLEVDYVVEQIASTANSKSIKRKILKDASCVDDTCADLAVEYADTIYGDLTQYSKKTGIIETDDLFNVYCEGSSCYRSVHSDEKLDEESGEAWIDEPYTKTVKRVVCDVTEPDPENQMCEVKDTVVPNNDYVSFKVTTEVDFYRPKSYYTKAFTGEVVESKSTLSVNSQQYSALGKNVYPIERKKESGLYSVDYTFSNLGISKFGQSNGVNLDTYEYQCSYEVYNNTTGYDCISKYDENGVLIPSDCSNFCFYVDDTVPDLECIQWNNMGESKGYGFVFRNVDLSNLFPSGREFGTNWSNATEIIAEIQNTADEVFIKDEHLVLSVTLNSDAIKKIREYNRYRNTNAGGYLDNSLIKCDLETSLDGVNNRFANCRSTFIDEIQSGSGVLGIQANKIVRSGSVIK